MKTFFSWLAMAVIFWLIGSLVAVVIELGLAIAGFPISAAGSGLIIVFIITFGLIWYGTRKRKVETE